MVEDIISSDQIIINVVTKCNVFHFLPMESYRVRNQTFCSVLNVTKYPLWLKDIDKHVHNLIRKKHNISSHSSGIRNCWMLNEDIKGF